VRIASADRYTASHGKSVFLLVCVGLINAREHRWSFDSVAEQLYPFAKEIKRKNAHARVMTASSAGERFSVASPGFSL
jgi:hypothetical protein